MPNTRNRDHRSVGDSPYHRSSARENEVSPVEEEQDQDPCRNPAPVFLPDSQHRFFAQVKADDFQTEIQEHRTQCSECAGIAKKSVEWLAGEQQIELSGHAARRARKPKNRFKPTGYVNLTQKQVDPYGGYGEDGEVGISHGPIGAIARDPGNPHDHDPEKAAMRPRKRQKKTHKQHKIGGVITVPTARPVGDLPA